MGNLERLKDCREKLCEKLFHEIEDHWSLSGIFNLSLSTGELPRLLVNPLRLCCDTSKLLFYLSN